VLVASALCALATSRPASAAEPLHLLTNDNPPFSIIDARQNVTGISADIVVEMTRRAGVPATIEHYPWSRAFATAESDADACIFSAARLPERETEFQWVGPIATNSWALFGPADFRRPLANLDAARGLVIGGQADEAKSLYLQARGLTVDLLQDDDLNPRRLEEGRIDLWVSGLETGIMKAAAVGIHDLKPLLVFRRIDSYLACNRLVAAATVEGLRQALDAMRRDGTVSRITQRYAGAVPQQPPSE